MAIYDILMAYGATPRTGVTPYRAMSNRPIHKTTKLERNKQHEMMEERGMLYKEKMKRSGLSIKEHNFMVGDYVLLKQKNTSKWSTVHEPVFTRLSMLVVLLSLEDELQMEEQYAETGVTSNWLMSLMHENKNEVGRNQDRRGTLLGTPENKTG